jgi:hypothetical protein
VVLLINSYIFYLLGTNEGNVVHCLPIRIEAAFSLARWQRNHAPTRPPDLGPATHRSFNMFEWSGMEILIGCLQGMFMERAESVSHASTNHPQKQIPPQEFLPLRNEFTDFTKTHLRAALLVALSSIKAGNGETPAAIVEILLTFAEKNDNSPVVSASSLGDQCYDDAHHCSLLLFCLSRVTCAASSSAGSSLLWRIIALAKYYIDR